jgi:sortase A
VNEVAGNSPARSAQEPVPERLQEPAPARALFSVLRPRPSRPTVRRRLERALWAVAASSAIYLGFVAVDRALFAQQASRQLAEISAAAEAPVVAASVEAPSPPLTPFLARLEIDSIGLEALVVDGVDDKTLRRAVGRMPRSARPGEAGNVVLAGHRDTDFRGLERLKRGDRIALRTARGEFLYEVEMIRVVDPDRIEYLRPTPEPSLTLVTCYPFRYVGPAPQRYIVRARELERPVVATL